MRPSEARVLLCEDSDFKRNFLIEMVQAGGGVVVDVAENTQEAQGKIKQVVRSGINAVLIDGNLSPHGKYGQEGQSIFHVGYRDGLVHRADVDEGVGAVAIGCSDTDQSLVGSVCGRNLRTSSPTHLHDDWTEAIEKHPAEPFYPPTGTIDRIPFDDFSLREMMEILFEPSDRPTISYFDMAYARVHSGTGNIEIVKESRERMLGSSTKDLVDFIELWQKQNNSTAQYAESRTAVITLEQGSRVYVVAHYAMRTYGGNGDILNGTSDAIETAYLPQFPPQFLRSLGLVVSETGYEDENIQGQFKF